LFTTGIIEQKEAHLPTARIRQSGGDLLMEGPGKISGAKRPFENGVAV
jgi:hypothetical protein